MKRDLVIFDFDGTLADSLSWLMSVIDEVADRYRFRRLDRGALGTLRGADIWDVLEHHRVPRWRAPWVARHLRERMHREIGRIRLFPGIEQVLQHLADSGARLALASSNSRGNVTSVLGPHAALFSHLECGASIGGKASRLRRVLKASRVPAARAWYIGDEIRDARAAAQAGIAFGAVGWGYTQVQALLAHGAAASFASAEELLGKLLE